MKTSRNWKTASMHKRAIAGVNILIIVFSSLLLSQWTVSSFAQTSSGKLTTPAPVGPNVYNIRAFGAKGDGKALDSPAINKAIDAAAAVGGGTVFFPAGTYRSFSIRLKSNITLYFDQGSVLLAASPNDGDGKYD